MRLERARPLARSSLSITVDDRERDCVQSMTGVTLQCRDFWSDSHNQPTNTTCKPSIPRSFQIGLCTNKKLCDGLIVITCMGKVNY